MNKKYISTTGIIVAGILLLTINVLANIIFKSSRVDLTENKLYTLSEGAQNILGNLEDPITLRLYFSENLASTAGILNYAQRVRDLLDEFKAAAKGNLNLIVIDPEPFSTEEDQAVQYGLQGVSVGNAGSPLYFGLVGTNSISDNEKVIPFLQPNKEEALEYDIVKLIYELSGPKKKTIGVMSTLPISGDATTQANQWAIFSTLQKSFNIKGFNIDTDVITDDVDVLLVIHPKDFSNMNLFAIDQYVLKGGRAMVFVDPYAEMDIPPHDPSNPDSMASATRNSNMKKLFDQWGVELAEDAV